MCKLPPWWVSMGFHKQILRQPPPSKPLGPTSRAVHSCPGKWLSLLLVLFCFWSALSTRLSAHLTGESSPSSYRFRQQFPKRTVSAALNMGMASLRTIMIGVLILLLENKNSCALWKGGMTVGSFCSIPSGICRQMQMDKVCLPSQARGNSA